MDAGVGLSGLVRRAWVCGEGDAAAWAAELRVLGSGRRFAERASWTVAVGEVSSSSKLSRLPLPDIESWLASAKELLAIADGVEQNVPTRIGQRERRDLAQQPTADFVGQIQGF